MTSTFEHQIITVVMSAVEEYGFAISGGRAAVIHNIVDRPTEDLDAFSNRIQENVLPEATTKAVNALTHAGFEVTIDEAVSNENFSRITVSDSPDRIIHVDLGYDWREFAPVTSEYGPVIDLRDFAASKISALWTRREVRDVIDVYGLVRTGAFTEQELINIAQTADPGFHEQYFLQRLDTVTEHVDSEFNEYGVDPSTAQKIRDLFRNWASKITSE